VISLLTSLPLLDDALTAAKNRLYEKLERECGISLFLNPNEQLLDQLEAIDHEKFREELWITHEELEEKTGQRGFIAFMLYSDGQPVAFLYGYQVPVDPSGFFLDEVATRIEGRGIGKILIVLSLIYCGEVGYDYIILYTEKSDDKGRSLEEFYEHMGFYLLNRDHQLGSIMRYDIDKERLVALYNRVMFKEGGPFPPYLTK
jgi:GNAT superfamily N-acetyltransferase